MYKYIWMYMSSFSVGLLFFQSPADILVNPYWLPCEVLKYTLIER